MNNVFAAITFDERARELMRAYDEAVLARAPRTRLVRPENRHITLAFLGPTPCVDEAIETLDAVRASAFDLVIGGFGVFGRGRRRLLWIGVERCPKIVACERAVREAFEARQFELPERAFTPHITLARKWGSTPVSLEELRGVVEPFPVRVETLSLMETDREDNHTVYRPLSTIALS